MKILSAYIAIIALWSTTPLAIKWSGEGVGAFYGLAFRMSLGLTCVLVFMLITQKKLPLSKPAIQTYLLSGLGICGAMGPSYWAAQYIPSGWISVMFGLTPLMTSIFSGMLLNEKVLSLDKIFAHGLALFGLVLIFGSAFDLGTRSVLCIGVMVLAVAAYAVTAVGIKKVDAGISGLCATAGGLIVALPFLWMFCLVEGSPFPEEIPMRSLLAIIYLGVLGTAIGFSIYYFVLKQMSAVSVSLITLITPVIALFIGSALNTEALTWKIMLGAGLIIIALMKHEVLPRKK